MKCILFIADAVRPDYLGCYNKARVNTREIDMLAEKGVRFDLTISAAPWTAPSIASIISGVYAHRHGVFSWDIDFPKSTYTLFHAFADRGHRVASFVFDQDYLFSKMPFSHVKGNTDRFDRVCSWLRAHAKEPFFLLIHSWATHMPYNVPHRIRKKWKAAKGIFIERLKTGGQNAVRESQAAYSRAIEYTSSKHIGTLIDLLKEQHIFEESFFIFISDHGESWGERLSDKSDIKGIHHLHGRFLYDEVLKVPLIFHWPERLPPSTVIDAQIRSVDLAPTLLELAGGRTRVHSTIDGTSLLALIEGTDCQDRPAFSATSENGRLSKISLRDPYYKYIHPVGRDGGELYDIRQDESELINIIEKHPKIARSMRKRIESELKGIRPLEMTAHEEALVLKRMEELGYL